MNQKRYAQLKESLTGAIAQGTFGPHDRLPSQRMLCEQYNISHMSVRRAINELISEGVIYAIPGKGLYVAEPKQNVESDPLMSFSEDMLRRGMQASTKLLAADLIAASAPLSQTLEVAPGAPLVYLRRLRLADGEPMALQSAYLPHTLCPDLLKHDLERESLFTILRAVYGLRLADSSNAAEAALASDEEADLLGLTIPAALLINEQITYLENGQPIEFVRSAYRGDRYRLRIERGEPRKSKPRIS